MAPIVIDEVSVIGARGGPFPDAIAALNVGQVQVEPLISGRFPLSQGVEALHTTASRAVLKILLDL